MRKAHNNVFAAERKKPRPLKSDVGRFILKGEEMRFLTIVTIIPVIGIIGHCSQQAAGDSSNSNDSIFQFYEFPSHPHLTHLCQQRVYGSCREIIWDAFASSAKPSKLVDYYRGKLGDAGFTREGEGGVWRRPADAPRPQRVLDIKAIGTDNPSRDCKKKPPSNSRAIIILSRMY
jgi:hypothetical protein